MQTPNFAASEFLDDLTLNAASSAVSGDFDTLAQAALTPGLLSPTSATYSSTGLMLTAVLNAPFGVLFSNGVVSQAHGTTTNADTQTYSVSFSGIVPASGSVTAYLLASYAQIQQQPKQIIGPQPGHPDYNPSFVPYTAYQVNVDSLSLSASSGAANNITTFELARFTLAAGASALATPNTNYQLRAAATTTTPAVYVSGGTYTVKAAQNATAFLAGSGVTFQLPAVSGMNGGDFQFIAATSGSTIAVSGSDLIYGTTSAPSSGVTTISMLQGQTINLVGAIGNWYSTSTVVGALGGILTGYLPNPGMASGAAATNVGTLGGVLSGTLPNPGMTAGAAATNVGTLSGVLSGTLPSPGMAAGAAATNIGALSGALSGTLPNPTIASSVALPGSPTTTTQASGTNNTTVATTAFVQTAIGNAVPNFTTVSGTQTLATQTNLYYRALVNPGFDIFYNLTMPATGSIASGWTAYIELPFNSIGVYGAVTLNPGSGVLLDNYTSRVAYAGTRIGIMFNGSSFETFQGTYSFMTSAFTVSASGSYSFSQTLGSTANFSILAQCTSADAGYASGAVLNLSQASLSQGLNTGNPIGGFTLYTTGTTVVLIISVHGIYVQNGTSYIDAQALTLSKWNFYISGMGV